MDKRTKNSIIWAAVLLVEALILKFAKRMNLWIYVILPIVAGFILTEFEMPKAEKKSKRNLQ